MGFDYLSNPGMFGPRAVGSGPIASAHTASTVPAGARWWDGATGTVYRCDYAGNFVNNGLTTLADKVQPTASFNPNNDFSLKIAFRLDADVVNFAGLFCQSTDKSGDSRALWLERNGSGVFAIMHSNGNSLFSYKFADVVDGNWHYIELSRSANAVSCKRDGTQVYSASVTGPIRIPLFTSIGTQPMERSINGQICCVEVVSSAGALKYRFNQLSGNVIQDLSGNGNTGTLTDRSPTTFSGNKYWIPEPCLT